MLFSAGHKEVASISVVKEEVRKVVSIPPLIVGSGCLHFHPAWCEPRPLVGPEDEPDKQRPEDQEARRSKREKDTWIIPLAPLKISRRRATRSHARLLSDTLKEMEGVYFVVVGR